MDKEFSLYQLLNVERTATGEQIKKSYRQLALQWHPDKNKEDEKAKEKFQKIVEAYNLLMNPEKRALYDETGMVDDLEQFKSAFDYYRNLYPKVTIQDIDNFQAKYRFSAEEEQDLIEFYNKHLGDMKSLLESIILSRNEDIERFLKFYDQQIAEKKLRNYRAYEITKKKIRKLDTHESAQADKELTSLVAMIQNKRKPTQKEFDNYFDQLAEKYAKQPVKKMKKEDPKLKKTQKK